MESEYTSRKKRPRRVSISTLPELSREGTFKLDHSVSKTRYRLDKASKVLKKTGKPICKVLKVVIAAPFMPCILFFVLFDKIAVATQQKKDEKREDMIFDRGKRSDPISVYEVVVEQYRRDYGYELG
ncbi:uncharacterized protein GGS22DRAFT_184137 [Annulohypoxylon maeteangense]|uniref:uncharacterized protein n=1 Tax=Annulohypoxylon maeteangense TaxID=1927788 RepID=UPI00200854DB|nr:uncharacterized protein GGS22DRAFT_184137 [Annulohypoxylon maeteangense]KAI0888555.1 hypothetical protein GGS22DRAFT_184137 [Annulohypoxylon maeteangense]